MDGSKRTRTTRLATSVVLRALDADLRGIQRGAGRFFVPRPLDSLPDVNEREEKQLSNSLSLSLCLFLLPLLLPSAFNTRMCGYRFRLVPQEHRTTAMLFPAQCCEETVLRALRQRCGKEGTGQNWLLCSEQISAGGFGMVWRFENFFDACDVLT